MSYCAYGNYIEPFNVQDQLFVETNEVRYVKNHIKKINNKNPIINNKSERDPPLEYIIYSDKDLFNRYIDFNYKIITTDQGWGDMAGSQVQLLMKVKTLDESEAEFYITDKFFCTPNTKDGIRPKNYEVEYSGKNIIDNFSKKIKSPISNISIILKLFNLYPGHTAVVKSINIKLQ
jgi:hypothetical protein